MPITIHKTKTWSGALLTAGNTLVSTIPWAGAKIPLIGLSWSLFLNENIAGKQPMSLRVGFTGKQPQPQASVGKGTLRGDAESLNVVFPSSSETVSLSILPITSRELIGLPQHRQQQGSPSLHRHRHPSLMQQCTHCGSCRGYH